MKTFCPAWSPLSSSTSKTLFLHLVTIPLVPLQTPFLGSKFLRIITGHPGFSSSFASGRPEQLMVFKYSTGVTAKIEVPCESATQVTSVIEIPADGDCG